MPTSGKHTIGTLVADALGIPLFHKHLAVDAALAFFPFGTPGFRRIRADKWCLCFDEAAEADQSFVFTFQPEPAVHPGLIDRLVEIVESKGGQVVFVELQCSVDAALARLGEPSCRSFNKLTDPELYMAIQKDGLNPSRYSGLLAGFSRPNIDSYQGDSPPYGVLRISRITGPTGLSIK